MNATWTLNLFPTRWRARHDRDFRKVLETHPASIADTVDLVLGAGAAHLRQNARSGNVVKPVHKPDPGASELPRHPLWMTVLWGHLSLFIAVNMLLLIVNLLTTPDNLWFPYALWGWSVALAVHIGITWPGRRWLRANALATGVISAGLIWINIQHGNTPWSLWAIWALVSVLVAHALWATGRVNGFGAHLLLTLLVGLELATVAISQRDGDLFRDLSIAVGYLLATVVVHAFYRFGNPTLLQAHMMLFGLVNVLLATAALSGDGSSRWFIYPLVAWTIILGAHALLSWRLTATPGGVWEASMLATLVQGNTPSPEGAAARRRTRWYGLLAHLVVFGIGAAVLVTLNVLAQDAGWWIAWPLSIWLVLLAAHAGMMVFTQHPTLGLWIGGGAAASAWIYVLDRSTGGGPWWFWPVGAWVVLTVAFAMLKIDLFALAGSSVSEPDRHSDTPASERT